MKALDIFSAIQYAHTVPMPLPIPFVLIASQKKVFVLKFAIAEFLLTFPVMFSS